MLCHSGFIQESCPEINSCTCLPIGMVRRKDRNYGYASEYTMSLYIFILLTMYGTSLPHLSTKNDKYGFVDEREIRIATGITLVLGLLSLFLVLFKAEFDIPLILVSLIAADFVLKVFISPRLSIFGSIVRVFLKK